MNKKLEDLVALHEETAGKIRAEIDKLEGTECNCDDQEEINLVVKENHDLGVDRLCGNCGGVIWDREL